jgi:predicted outer membrane protein
MTFRKIAATGLAGTALVVAGCSSSPRPAAPQSTFVLPSTAAALTPAIYMQLASSSSLYAIRASELAMQRSQSNRVRTAARAIIADQGGVGSQLSYAGRRLDLLPTATLTAQQAADLERLTTTANFDEDYRRTVGATLSRSLEAHQAFARAGSSPTLRPVAEMAAPVTKKNLDAVRR